MSEATQTPPAPQSSVPPSSAPQESSSANPPLGPDTRPPLRDENRMSRNTPMRLKSKPIRWPRWV